MEGRSDHDLERMILSGSIASISKQAEVSKIHEGGYLSPMDYLEAFKNPLMEEIKAKILLGLNSVSQSPYYKLLGVLPMQSGLVYIDIDTNHWNHVAQDGDLFLLTNQEAKFPKWEQDDQNVFVLATDIGHNNKYVRGFPAKINCAINSDIKYAIFLCNISEDLQVWNVLHKDFSERTMIRMISSPSLMDKKRCGICAIDSPDTNLFFNSELNEEQQVLAMKIVTNSKCDQCENIDVVWGLPGTGKTKILTHVLVASCHSKLKTLVCAPNDLHFSSLCCNLNDELIKKAKRLHHGLDHGIGDVLLLSDSVAMKNSITKEFCLGWRLNEVMPCMAWKSRLVSLVKFLEEDFRETFKEVTTDMKLSVLKMLRESFKRKSSMLVNSLMTLWKHTPCHIFSPEAAEGLASLDAAVKKFNDLLAKEGVTEEDVMAVFKIRISKAKSSRSKFSTIKSSNKPSRATQSQSNSTSVTDLRKARENCINYLKQLEKNLELPYEKNIEWMRQYLIQHSTIILSLPSEAFLLHSADTKSLNTLIVIGAAQLKECELLPALSLPSIKHLWLIGDHNQICPSVNSEMNEVSGLGRSLFQRLVSLEFVINHKLTTQYRMHPAICCLLSKYFYAGRLLSAETAINSSAVNFIEFNNYTFVNVQAERVFDAIKLLIFTVVKAWQGKDLKLEVGVICSTGKQDVQHCYYGPLSVSIQSIDKIEVKDYDILITLAHGLPNNDHHINYIITRARQHLWIVGDETELIKEKSVWESLILESKQQGSFINFTSLKEYSAVIENQDVNVSSWDSLSSALQIVVPDDKAPPHEFSWVRRPCNGKFLLPPVRDQRGLNHCTLHSSLATMEFLNKHKAASNLPAKDCPAKLSTNKLLAKYEKKHGEIGKEKDGRGRRSLVKVLFILENEGARCEIDNKLYKISSSVLIYDKHDSCNRSLGKAAELPRKGKALIGSFLLSRNYQRYKPGDIYEYDDKLPVLTPLNNNPATHAVMVIGGTEGTTEELLKDGHFVAQNSHGDYFGEMGICRVAAGTIELLYEIDL